MQFVERVNAPQVKDDLIPFRVGMTVRVGVTVVEGNKTRVQPYEGIIIGIHRAGVATTITVRKAFQGYGVERIFPIHSPLCTFEEVRGAGKPVVSTPSFASLIRFFTAGFATDAWARVLSRVSIVPAGAPRSTDRARAPCRAAPPLEKPKPCDLLRKKIFLPPNAAR
jgi:ribosomal protein L19